MLESCMKQPELDAIIICPCTKKSSNSTVQCINTFVKCFYLNCFLDVTYQEAAWKHDKDFVNPI